MPAALATSPSQLQYLLGQTRNAHSRAMSTLSTLDRERAMYTAIEQASFMVTLAGCGYASGRFNNPKDPILGAPFELYGALFAYSGALAAEHFGAQKTSRAAINAGTAFLASPLFKWAAGMGVKARPATTTTQTPTKGMNTGLATPRREVIGAAVPRHTITGNSGALSASEAARLVAR